MAGPRSLDDLLTPAAVIDLDRMQANLEGMATYARNAGLTLRPHTKTHKTPELALEQLNHGAIGVTVATLREAEVMSAVADNVFLAYAPIGRLKLNRLFGLPDDVRITVAVDSTEALQELERAADEHDRVVGVLVEIDAGMHRVGTTDPAVTRQLAERVTQSNALEWRGITFYPGHIREHIEQQDRAIHSLIDLLDQHLAALAGAGLVPETVSGGSTPTALHSHKIGALTEIRPGTYIFNDRTTASVGACSWDQCAYTVLATVVSTTVAGQAVVDAGSKALAREEIRGADATGFAALLDHPEVVVTGLSEEHGLLDLRGSDWQPRVGDRVRIVPNHVCVSVNLHERLYGLRGTAIEASWLIRARNWSPAPQLIPAI